MELKLDEFNVNHEFNFVYLKNSLHEKEYLTLLNHWKKLNCYKK